MSKKIFKTLALFMVLSFILTLAACGGGKTTEGQATPAPTSEASAAPAEAPTPAPLEDKTITMMMTDTWGVKWTDPNLGLWKIYKDVAKLTVNCQPVPEDVFDEKFNIFVGSGDIPDIMVLMNPKSDGSNLKIVMETGPKGLFVPISDYVDRLPNMKKYIDKYSNCLKTITSADGKYYIIPTVSDYNPVNMGLILRDDLLKKANFDINSIKTTDDLYNAMKALKEVNGGKSVMSARWGLANIEFLTKIFGIGSLQSGQGIYYDPEINGFNHVALAKNGKAAVEYLANMFKDGLLHPDWASMQDKDWEGRFNSGDLAMSADNMQSLDGYKTAATISNIPEYHTSAIIPPTYNGIFYPWVSSPSNLSSWGALAVSAKTQALDNILAITDWAFDDANYEKLQYGEDIYDKWPDGSSKAPDWATNTAANDNWYSQVPGVPPLTRVSKEDVFYGWATFEKGKTLFEPAAALYVEKVYSFTAPVVIFNEDESEQLKNILTPLDTYVKENLVKFINNTRPMSEWDAFVAEVKGMNVEQVITMYNDKLAVSK